MGGGDSLRRLVRRGGDLHNIQHREERVQACYSPGELMRDALVNEAGGRLTEGFAVGLEHKLRKTLCKLRSALREAGDGSGNIAGRPALAEKPARRSLAQPAPG